MARVGANVPLGRPGTDQEMASVGHPLLELSHLVYSSPDQLDVTDQIRFLGYLDSCDKYLHAGNNTSR